MRTGRLGKDKLLQIKIQIKDINEFSESGKDML